MWTGIVEAVREVCAQCGFWGVTLFLLATCAHGQGVAPTRVPTTTSVPVPPPPGYISFCLRFPQQCSTKPGSAMSVALTDDNWHTLQEVNRSVNQSIWPEDDKKHYGRAEYWTIPTDGYGDCDDYAVTKRKDLIDLGFPASALRLAVAITPTNERHAVLTVSTDKGDLVLDNLRNDVISWSATGFRWIERQDAANPLKWASFGPLDPVSMTTAELPAEK